MNKIFTKPTREKTALMRQMMQRRPPEPTDWIARLAVFALVFLVASAGLVFPSDAQSSAARPPISDVQLEKLLRVIDRRGENVRLSDPVTEALGLGDGVIVRQATATDPVARQSYFFATIPGSGQYLIGTRNLQGGDIFLAGPDLRLVAGVAVRDRVQKIPLPEAGKDFQDILAKFVTFLEMN